MKLSVYKKASYSAKNKEDKTQLAFLCSKPNVPDIVEIDTDSDLIAAVLLMLGVLLFSLEFVMEIISFPVTFWQLILILTIKSKKLKLLFKKKVFVLFAFQAQAILRNIINFD